ncbi:MAG: TetR/AcrR family transcriptional regulator [Pseudomonadota bacterium]
MPKIKTRDRILRTALELFNTEGEAQVSTVDIASVIGISPGNLYYHFKGKEAIIEALFDDFEAELQQVLTAPINRPLAVEDNWIFLYIVFEEINDFRFFYEAISSILERCPALRPRFARLLSLKKKTCLALLDGLESKDFIAVREEEKNRMAERFAMHMSFWIQYMSFSEVKDERAVIHQGVYNGLLQLAPFVKYDREAYTALLTEYFQEQSA